MGARPNQRQHRPAGDRGPIVTNQATEEDDHSERATEAMGVYMVDALHVIPSLKFDESQQALLMAAYMQGAAAIQSAELTAQALDRLTAAIALSGTPVRGSA